VAQTRQQLIDRNRRLAVASIAELEAAILACIDRRNAAPATRP